VTGSLVTPELRSRIRSLAEPIARGFGRLGLTPNQLTLIGFGIAIVASVAAAQQAWVAAGLLVLFGGIFDLFDGALARATGTVSRFGAFMDSVFDRWGEGAVYVGIAWGCVAADFGLGAILATGALTSAVMVSYARAKSEGLGLTVGTGMASIGLAPREVRIAILVLGLVLAGLATPTDLVIDCARLVSTGSLADCFDNGGISTAGRVLAGALALITILATITTIQRILHVRAQASREDRPAD